MEAVKLNPESFIKEYFFNHNHVCTNPEKAFSCYVDLANYLTITVAQHPLNGRWCVGEDYASNQVCSFEGGSSSASHNPNELGTGYLTAKEGLRIKVNHILENLNRYRLHPKILEALKIYGLTLDIVVPGQQLPLF